MCEMRTDSAGKSVVDLGSAQTFTFCRGKRKRGKKKKAGAPLLLILLKDALTADVINNNNNNDNNKEKRGFNGDTKALCFFSKAFNRLFFFLS